MRNMLECLALAAVLALALVLRYSEPYYLSDLAVVPDSAQYTVAAYNLAHGKGLWIYINDLKLPLMYPCGFSVILAAFYLLTGAALHYAVYIVLAFGLACIALAYLFGRAVFGRPAALLSALLLAVAPSCVGYSQVLISDMVSNTFIILGLWLAWEASRREGGNQVLWMLAGVSCGFSTTVHMLSGVTVAPLIAACLCGGSCPRDRMRAVALALLGFVIGFGPQLAYNGIVFGNIFSTGYGYWQRSGKGQEYFSLRYAIRNTAVSERGDQQGNIPYYLWHFLGLSWPTLFAPYFFEVLLCACIGGAACLARAVGTFRTKLFARGVILSIALCAAGAVILMTSGTFTAEYPAVYPLCILVTGACAALVIARPHGSFGERQGRGIRTFGVMSAVLIVFTMGVLFFYGYQMSKFLLPIVPFVCMLAGCGIAIVLGASRGGNRYARVAVAALLAVTAWGCWRPFAASHFRSRAPTWWYEGLDLLDRTAPGDAVLISGIDGVYVTHYFVKGSRRSYVPISREVEYVQQRDLPLPVALNDRLYLRGLLLGGRKVYMDGFTYVWWARHRALLEREFALVPVAPYYGGNLHLYELRLKNS